MAKPEGPAGEAPDSHGPDARPTDPPVVEAGKAWSGRFSTPADELAERFTASIGFDQRLAQVDIFGSIAHALMLGCCGIISSEDSALIVSGLEWLSDEVRAGRVTWDVSAEDIHMNIEKKLHERVGEVAGRLHTARSRNDQVATDTRLWLRSEIDCLLDETRQLQTTLTALAGEHLNTILPGYTHTQHAQPVLLAHHLLAYFWMVERDRERLLECRTRVNVLPLGSAALAGTPHPIDRQWVAAYLGFERVAENSMDAVSDRDFVIEALSVLSMLMMHLSRLCNELVLWQSREFSFVMMSDSMTTGSSIMPQKKNPDVAELVRGKTGRVYGDLVALLTIMKGLPLTYNSDMQEDKERLFDGVDTARASVNVVERLLGSTRFRTEQMAAAVHGDFSTATDLADLLARKGQPFRSAHSTVGRLVSDAEQMGKPLEDWSVKDLQSVSPLLDEDALACLQPDASVRARTSEGGTAADRVREQLRQAYQKLGHSWEEPPRATTSTEPPL